VFPGARYTLRGSAWAFRGEAPDPWEGALPSEIDPSRREGAPGAAALLLTGTAREVLARLVPEDPLGLRQRLAARVRARALLVDLEPVVLHALASCALRAAGWRGEPELERWLDERAEESLGAYLAGDTDERDEGMAGALAHFAPPLSLDARALSGACARFNRLPFEQREAFFALVLDQVAADRLARARGLSLPELARRARSGLEVFRSAQRASPAAGAAPRSRTGASG